MLSLSNNKSKRSEAIKEFGARAAVLRIADSALNLSEKVLLGYLYAATTDLSQAIAWFWQGYQTPNLEIKDRDILVEGIKRVLALATQEELDSFSKEWGSSREIRGWVLEEKRRRMEVGDEYKEFGLPDWLFSRQSVPVAAQNKKPTILAFLPASGKFEKFGTATRKGIELAVSARGELYDLEVRDLPQSSGAAAVEAENAVRGIKPSVIIGPLISDQASAVAERLGATKVPVISLSKKDSFQVGGNIFRLGATSKSQAFSLLELAVNVLHAHRFAVIYPETPAAAEIAQAFKAEVISRSLEISFERTYRPGDTSGFSAISAALEAAAPEVLLFADDAGKAGQFMANFPDRRTVPFKLFGLAGWEESPEMRLSAGSLDGAYFVRPFVPSEGGDLTKTFVDSFRARYGTNPDFLAAQGFDAATIALAALRGGGKGNSEGAVRAIRNIDRYEGLTGSAKLLPSGDFIRKYRIGQLQGGNIVPVQF